MDKIEKKITIGIPAYKAQDFIEVAVSSINIQTTRDIIQIIIAPDLPGENYSFLKRRFPNLDIKILKCTENTGPGLARQRILDACETDWVYFMDSDDTLYSVNSIEKMYAIALSGPKVIEVVCPFLEESMNPKGEKGKYIKKSDPWSPWVFSRLFKMSYIRENNIRFSDLRAGEDCEFVLKFQFLAENDDRYEIKLLDEVSYLWKNDQKTSLTRVGKRIRGIPQFNYDMGCWGVIESTLRALKFLKSKGKIPTKNYFIAAMSAIVKSYACYHLSLVVNPVFAPQHIWFGKYFYHELYNEIDSLLEIKDLEKILEINYKEIFKSIRENLKEEEVIPMDKFLDILRTEEYGGVEELWKIRDSIPSELTEVDTKSGLDKCLPKRENN